MILLQLDRSDFLADRFCNAPTSERREDWGLGERKEERIIIIIYLVHCKFGVRKSHEFVKRLKEVIRPFFKDIKTLSLEELERERE